MCTGRAVPAVVMDETKAQAVVLTPNTHRSTERTPYSLFTTAEFSKTHSDAELVIGRSPDPSRFFVSFISSRRQDFSNAYALSTYALEP